MKKEKPKQDWYDELRRRAEEAVDREKGKDVLSSKGFAWMEEMLSKKNIKDITAADMYAWVHELYVYQIELEMQNEDLKRSQQELEESRNKYLEFYEFSPVGYFIIDNQGTILEVNLTGAALLGQERGSLTGRRFQLFVETGSLPDFNSFCNCMFVSDVRQACELVLVKASPLYAYLEGVAMRYNEGSAKLCKIAVVDISRRKQAEEEQARLKEQLSHAHNLASVGALAGGVAHNFNNILMVVMGYASLLLKELKEDNPLREYAQKIINSSQIAANLAQDLLAFGRKKPIRLQQVDLNKNIKDAKGMLSTILKENIQLKTAFTEKDCFVMADSSEMLKVLVSLATNARDAMPDGGELEICTDVVEMDDALIKLQGFGEIGKYATVSVSDTGIGMDEETRSRVFEPFFTTKEVGKGTGLGLASVYGIVKQHNGYIDVHSISGKGTTFKIYLPLITPAIVTKSSAKGIASIGDGTIF